MYYVNDGVYGSFSCQFFDHHYPKAIPLTMNQGNLYKSSIWGPTCDSLDCITHEAMLPEVSFTFFMQDWKFLGFRFVRLWAFLNCVSLI